MFNQLLTKKLIQNPMPKTSTLARIHYKYYNTLKNDKIEDGYEDAFYGGVDEEALEIYEVLANGKYMPLPENGSIFVNPGGNIA